MKLAHWLEEHARHLVLGSAVVGLIYVACIPAAAPVGDLAACVATDALKGDSIAQIALDCKADVAAVIIALLSTPSKEVPATMAYNEALKTKAVLMTMDGGAL